MEILKTALPRGWWTDAVSAAAHLPLFWGLRGRLNRGRAWTAAKEAESPAESAVPSLAVGRLL